MIVYIFKKQTQEAGFPPFVTKSWREKFPSGCNPPVLPSAHVALAANQQYRMAANRRHFTVASTRRLAYARVSTGQLLSVVVPELMDFGRTGHGDGERQLSLQRKYLSCCLRTPVGDRCLSSGQKRDRADGSSRQTSIARQFWALPFVCTKGRRRNFQL